MSRLNVLLLPMLALAHCAPPPPPSPQARADAATLAAACRRLGEDRRLAEHLAGNALALVRERYSRPVALRILRGLLPRETENGILPSPGPDVSAGGG